MTGATMMRFEGGPLDGEVRTVQHGAYGELPSVYEVEVLADPLPTTYEPDAVLTFRRVAYHLLPVSARGGLAYCLEPPS